MLKSSKKWWIVGGMAASFGVVVLLAGLVGAVLWEPNFAFAQDTDPTTSEPCGKGGWGLFGWGGRSWTMFDTVAEALGLTPQGLFTELHDAGKTVTEIAEEKEIDIDAVRDAINASRKEAMQQAIEQAVEDGNLSQEQADWLLEGLEQGFFPGGPGMGRGGHFPFGFAGRGPWGRLGGFRGIPQEQ